MENINSSIKTLNIVNSIMHDINIINFHKMSQQMIGLTVETDKLLEDIADIIYSKALKKYNFTELYAKLCACMINDDKFNSPENLKITFQKILMNKCYEVFFSYKSYQEELNKLLNNLKFSIKMEPTRFRKHILNEFLFEYDNKLLTNCIFICELFNQGVLRKRIIKECITELLKEKNDIQIQCLCIIIKLVGPKLSKICNFDNIVKRILLFLNEYSTNNKVSSTLKNLILEIKKMHLNDWIDNDFVNLCNIVKLSHIFSELPIQLKNQYDSKSYNIMAVYIFEECYDILFNFVNKKDFNEIIHLLTTTNTYLNYDHVSFVVSIIVIAIEECQNIRIDAGKLIDNLVHDSFLLISAVQLGIKKVLNDPGIKDDFPNISHLVSDITREFKFK